MRAVQPDAQAVGVLPILLKVRLESLASRRVRLEGDDAAPRLELRCVVKVVRLLPLLGTLTSAGFADPGDVHSWACTPFLVTDQVSDQRPEP